MVPQFGKSFGYNCNNCWHIVWWDSLHRMVLYFLSVAEGSIWTTGFVIITAVPFAWDSVEVLAAPFGFFIKSIKRWNDPDSQSVGESFHLRKFHEYTGTITLVVYFTSHAALLILPLIALRSLSLNSLLDINWSSYILHNIQLSISFLLTIL